jgi:molybdopterin molybdotransferase
MVVNVLLNVKMPDEVCGIIEGLLEAVRFSAELVPSVDAVGRVLHKDIISDEDVPGFNRSTVDGYAVFASDTFGCSESLPAVLTVAGEIPMGGSVEAVLTANSCYIVSTGGALPGGADAVVMVENTEDYGGNMVGIHKSVAPGNNVVQRGDDVSAGVRVLPAGTVLTPHDIGVLATLGYALVEVRKRPVVGVISTGDELVDVSASPRSGQVRNVNTPLLLAAVTRFGAVAKDCGLIGDDESDIRAAVKNAAEVCDLVLVSGGSSAGLRDLTARVIESEGELLMHGIAIKPGKPTILGVVGGKPVFGLPGHPVAAYLVTELFVRMFISGLMGAKVKRRTTVARISEALSSNHGRAEYIAVRLDDSGLAVPVRSKSGLISSLVGVDGYICIERNSEGLVAGAEVVVVYF